MIRIDNISFGFVAADEQFTYGLYADWDRFCHISVEEVVEECLSAYDKRKVLHEIELLDLDLGSIPEENFYREFPRRLRNELQKALPLLNISTESLEKNTAISRLDNLLFYLEHGYLKAEWADESFSLAEELEWIATQPEACIRKISKLCLGKEHALRRLIWQSDNEDILLTFFAVALSEPSVSLYEKRRFLLMYLEVKPDIPVHFIHETDNDAQLQEMASLLDTVSVRRIMETEAGEHTEVDLPPYWHYLYEWLIRYYPFNGLAIYGSKSDFIYHLNYRLLTFIHKQNYFFYFSKLELTVGFLLEVFGPIHYIEVLNAIYDLQPHNPDGSPIHDSYYNQELYRMFMSLSLLRLPQKLAFEKPHDWIDLLRKQSGKYNAITHLSYSFTASQLLQSLTRVDFRQASILLQMVDWLEKNLNDFPFLAGGSIVFSKALTQTLLLYIKDVETLGKRVLGEEEIKNKFLSYLYNVYTGKSNYPENEEWTDLSVRISIGNDISSIDEKLLHSYICLKPKELLDYISRSVRKNTVSLERWLVRLNTDTWMQLATGLSLLQADLLQQILSILSDNNQAKEPNLRQALATYLTENHPRWVYNSKEETVHSIVESLPLQQEKTKKERESIEHIVKQKLNIMNQENYYGDEQKAYEYLTIPNAGLCLFNPWFQQLFYLVDYLIDKKRKFKDTESQIRAVFLLQYLTCQEEKEYRETDLLLNRLIVGLSLHIPLPKSIELNDKEKEIANSMLISVKSDWDKMRNTSMRGFLESFILRRGRLEQKDEKWVLTVEGRAYDILLDSLPWPLNYIRLPWLNNNCILVNWRN